MTALAPELASSASRGDMVGLRRQFTRRVPAHDARSAPGGGDPRGPVPTDRQCAARLRKTSPPPTVPPPRRRSWRSRSGSSRSPCTSSPCGFYAMQDTRTPFLLNCLENGLNIVLAIALYPAFGVEGLALAWSIAYIVAMVVALWRCAAASDRLDGRHLADTFLRVLAGTVVLGRCSSSASARPSATPPRAGRSWPRVLRSSSGPPGSSSRSTCSGSASCASSVTPSAAPALLSTAPARDRRKRRVPGRVTMEPVSESKGPHRRHESGRPRGGTRRHRQLVRPAR